MTIGDVLNRFLVYAAFGTIATTTIVVLELPQPPIPVSIVDENSPAHGAPYLWLTDKASDSVKVMFLISTGDADLFVGQSFIVRVVLSVVGNSVFDASRQAEISPIISRSELTLRIAGADLSPEGYQVVGSDLSAMWAVKINEPGTHQGFLELRSSEPNIFEIKTSTVSFSVDSDEPSRGFVDTYFKPLGIILGLLFTVTNLVRFVVFLTDRRKNSNKRAEELKKSKQRLIKPGDDDFK